MSKKSRYIIEVENLEKRYGDFVAVRGVSFRVKEGEVFGLLGPNGAGKTTTLEIIETLRDASAGSVLLDGTDVFAHPQEVKSKIGIQLQAAGFYPRLNLVQLIDLFADLYGAQVDPEQLLETVELLPKKKAVANKLSGGQKQRFSIATTLINKPKVIFLDEPTTGLDPQARRNLWKLILKIKKSGTTIVLTTHYMDEAEILCDRVAIMDEGRIIDIDSPQKLIDKLLSTGFTKEVTVKQANLEDVFIHLTGKTLRE